MPIVVEQVAVETMPSETSSGAEASAGSQVAVPTPRALAREVRRRLEQEAQRAARVRAH